MLNDDQLKELKVIIEKTNISFKEISDIYFQNFSEQEFLPTCFTIGKLIQNFNVQKETEIFTCIYLLYYIPKKLNFNEKPDYLSSLSVQNPLINFFTQEMLQKNRMNINQSPEETFEFLLQNQVLNFKVKQTEKKENSSLGGLEQYGISPFIKVNEMIKHPISIQNVEYNNFIPKFKIIKPPILEEDISWIYSNIHEIEPLWDFTNELPDEEYLELFQKSFTDALSPKQREKIIQKFDNISLLKCGLTSNKFPSLVEKNPLIAVESLKKLKRTNSNLLDEYLTILIHMNITLQSLEVMNQFSNELSKEFLQIYVSKGISICEKENSNRLTRLFSVFLQNLIRKNTIKSFDDIYQIIKGFCIQFPSIKETQVLFQLLDQHK
eukprot:gene1277-11364_t